MKKILTESEKKIIKLNFDRFLITEVQGNLKDPNWLKVVQSLKLKGFAYGEKVESGDVYSGGLLRKWNQGTLTLNPPLGTIRILYPYRWMGYDQGGPREMDQIQIQIDSNDPTAVKIIENGVKSGLLRDGNGNMYSVPLNQPDKVINFVDSYLNPTINQQQ